MGHPFFVLTRCMNALDALTDVFFKGLGTFPNQPCVRVRERAYHRKSPISRAYAYCGVCAGIIPDERDGQLPKAVSSSVSSIHSVYRTKVSKLRGDHVPPRL